MSNLAIANTENGGFMSTVDNSTPEGRIALVNALNASTSLKDMSDTPFVVKDIVLNKGVRSQTGEDCVNTHLILDNGDCVMSQSDGIARSALAIINAWNGDLGDGIKMVVDEKKLSNGRTLKSLKVIEQL